MTCLRPLTVVTYGPDQFVLPCRGVAPPLAPGGLVERDQERLAFVIEDDEQRVAVEPGPRALAEGHEHRAARPKSFCQTSVPSSV